MTDWLKILKDDIDAIKAITDALPDSGALSDLAAILADTIMISGGALPASPVLNSLARFIASGGTALGAPLPDSMSLIDLLGDFTGAHDGGAQDDNVKASLDLAHTDLNSIITSQGRMLLTMDFWSTLQEEVEVTAAGATETLPSIEVTDLPDGATIVRAYVMFKFRMIENTYAGVNKLNGATDPGASQVIQIQDDGESGWFDAINFVDDFFTLASEAREGGDVIVGSIDVAARVDENDIYDLTWLVAKADSDFILFNDVQVGLRIWYSI